MSLKPRRVDFDVVWGRLQDTIGGVIMLRNVPRTVWNDRFSDVYELCVAFPDSLADQLYNKTRQFLIDHVAALLADVQRADDSQLVSRYAENWDRYSRGVTFLHRLYQYLNQQHIRTHRVSDAELIYGNQDVGSADQMEIGELGLEVWKTGMIGPLYKRLVGLLLAAVAVDRAGGKLGTGTGAAAASVDAVQKSILSFVDVQSFKRKGQEHHLYQESFEKPFLDDLGEYYAAEAARLSEACSVSEYMRRVIERIEEEVARCRRFLHCDSLPKVELRCRKHMVEEYLPFITSECRDMVERELRVDLTNMYTLLKNLPNIDVLVDTVLQHIKEQGTVAIGNLQGDAVHMLFVENLLGVYKRYGDLITEVFNRDQLFTGALDKACNWVINHRQALNAGSQQRVTPCRSPELLAKYCDTLLRKTSRGVCETEIEEKLAQSITIFKYIDDKDVFQKFYSRMLAKRLIHQQTQSMDAEEAMINRLKQACGYEFTSKLHRMFTDMSVSADLNTRFAEYLREENVDLQVNSTIYVLQAGAWPLGQAAVTPFALPQQLERSVQKFEDFYNKRFNGRRLTWLHHLCQAELRLGYLKRPFIVTVQTFQMAILLLFERADALTYKDMQDTLQLTQDQFQRHLVSLIDSKLLLIDGQPITTQSGSKSGNTSDDTSTTDAPASTQPQSSSTEDSAPNTSTSSADTNATPSGSTSTSPASAQQQQQQQPPTYDLVPESVLRLNLSYTNKRTRFRITAAVQKDSPQEVEHTVSSVEEDRKLYLQAAIVRIMKARKVLRHNALVQEVCAQSRVSFAPSIPMIKKCIEALIDKQYIERTQHSTEEYSYIA